MPNEIKTIRQTLKVNETNEEIPAIALLIEGSFDNILNHIFLSNSAEKYETKMDIISDAMFKGSNIMPDEIKFVNEVISADDNSGRKVNALAIVLEEPLTRRLDATITISNNRINSYEKAITDAIFRGIDCILKTIEK